MSYRLTVATMFIIVAVLMSAFMWLWLSQPYVAYVENPMGGAPVAATVDPTAPLK